MAHSYEVRYVRVVGDDVGALQLGQACSALATEGYRLVRAEPHLQDGTTQGWMLFFEK